MFTMRFDLRVPGQSAAERADSYAAAVDMTEWSEGKGGAAVIVSEHHGVADGYLPAPLILASAMAARTDSIPIAIGAALLPLYEPVRLAEEMIVLDHLSRGRVSYVFGIGYREDEYTLHGRDYAARGSIADDALDRLREALAAADAAGPGIHVTPAPFTPGGPAIAWGGASKPAARRAGSRGLDLFGSGNAPGVAEAYDEAARAAGVTPGTCTLPDPGTPMTTFVDDDQDGGWSRLGPYLMNDVLSYGEWNAGNEHVASISFAKTWEALRAERGTHRIFTVAEAAEFVRTNFVLPLHPLCGGVPPEVAWTYLRRVVDEVLPAAAAS